MEEIIKLLREQNQFKDYLLNKKREEIEKLQNKTTEELEKIINKINLLLTDRSLVRVQQEEPVLKCEFDIIIKQLNELKDNIKEY